MTNPIDNGYNKLLENPKQFSLICFHFSLQQSQVTMPGDILLIACFISYVGCFTRAYRVELQTKMWIPAFKACDVSFELYPSISKCHRNKIF